MSHRCEGELPQAVWGPAITSCEEMDDGTLWAGNDEYGSQVNYCPYCGYEAAVKAEIELEEP